LIFVHEFGHFFTAKLSGVQVNEFSMFMGPAIWKKQKGETLYSIRCIPIGGYCAMEGEDSETDNPRSFQKAAWWKRVIILIAGAAMNFIAGFLIVMIVLSCTQTVIPQIDSLRPGSTLAAEGGLQSGDMILEMNGQKVTTTNDFSVILEQDLSVTRFDVLVRRNGQQILLDDVTMIPQEFEADEYGEAGTFYGIYWATRRLTFKEVITQTWHDCCYFVEMVWMGLGMFISGEAGFSDMAGPVGIVGQMTQMATASDSVLSAVMNLLYFGGFIAVNLAVMNLLPIPALDGGRVVALLLTAGIEAIIGRKIDPKYEGYIHGAGMLVLLALMAVIMFKDIFVIVKG
jgi:regulator of sigma E protease